MSLSEIGDEALYYEEEAPQPGQVDQTKVGPQPGPQSAFLSTDADIAVYGGAAGGGKTYALLLEVVRHGDNPLFGGVIFRKTSVQVRNEGGLWDESYKLYTKLNWHPREGLLEWESPQKARLKFSHLEYDKSVYDWQGSQISFIGFEELTHFSERQFWYMLSRNRSTSGVPGYVRATTNPDADSWVRKLVDWWIDANGYAIPERSGVLRWFIRVEDALIWADTKEALIEQYGPDTLPKSFTFIPSKLEDNQVLAKSDPGYLANLNALTRVDRLRLKEGNWNVRNTAGNLFKKQWFPVVDAIPANWIQVIRFWDRAATKPNEANKDPDWTRGLLLYKYSNGTYCVGDIKSDRNTPGQIETLIKNTAGQDGWQVEIMSQQDPGSAGVSEAESFCKMLAGYNVRTVTISKDKVVRAKPVSAQAEAGNIMVKRSTWNDEFFTELELFPEGPHDDQVDVLSGAFNALLSEGVSILTSQY